MKLKLSFILLIVFLNCFAEKASLIIFSYNRPLQLYALLESVKRYVTGLESINVIYRADKEFRDAYNSLSTAFGDVKFVRQKNPKNDFKSLTVKAFNESPSKYIIFAVDDIVVKDHINFDQDTELLKKYDAFGIFYRLGKHVDYCYTLNTHQGVPSLTSLENDIYIWRFDTGSCDWNYPNNLDMTLYAKEKIARDVYFLNYNTPNTMEGQWASRANLSQNGICYGESRILNLPMNMVQRDGNNRHNNSYSVHQLLDIFKNGLKLDINPFFKMQNQSAHIDFSDIRFTER